MLRKCHLELKDERNRLEKEVFKAAEAIISPEPSVPLLRYHRHPIWPLTTSCYFSRQTSVTDTSRRSSTCSSTSSLQSPRLSADGASSKDGRFGGPLRAFANDPTVTSKPRLAIDRKAPSTTKSDSPVLVRLGSIKQQDLLKKYPLLSTTATTAAKSTKPPDTATSRANSADKFRRMVLDCREISSWTDDVRRRSHAINLSMIIELYTGLFSSSVNY